MVVTSSSSYDSHTSTKRDTNRETKDFALPVYFEIEQCEENRGIRLWSKLKGFYLSLVQEIKVSYPSYFLYVLYIFFSVMNKLFMKRTMQLTENYGFIIFEIQLIIFTATFAIIYAVKKRFSQRKKEKLYKIVQPTPTLSFFKVAVADDFSLFISFIGIIKTTGNIQSFIFQLSIPVNMLICYLFLKYRYHLCNYIGASIIIIVIAAMEIIMSHNIEKENSILFNMIYMCSLIPMAFSNMLREWMFKKYKTDIYLYLGVVGFIQIFLSFLMLPLYILPLLKQVRVPFSEIPNNLLSGLKCLFLRQSSIVENCGYSMDKLCDYCEDAWQMYILYSFFNISDNLLACYLINKFSAMTYTIVSCVQGPSTTIAYYFHFLAGDATRKPQVLDFITLIGYFVGSVTYRIGNIIMEKELEREEEKSTEIEMLAAKEKNIQEKEDCQMKMIDEKNMLLKKDEE